MDGSLATMHSLLQDPAFIRDMAFNRSLTVQRESLNISKQFLW